MECLSYLSSLRSQTFVLDQLRKQDSVKYVHLPIFNAIVEIPVFGLHPQDRRQNTLTSHSIMNSSLQEAKAGPADCFEELQKKEKGTSALRKRALRNVLVRS